MESNFKIVNKLLLAPMVRINTLPFRLLALKYGADIVFTEEIIAKKLCVCEKIYNKDLNTNDYLSSKDGSLVLRTHVYYSNISQMRKAN
jgi:tRNA-dihydrouridine synthase 2